MTYYFKEMHWTFCILQFQLETFSYMMYNKTAKDRVPAHSFNFYVFRDFFNLDGPFHMYLIWPSQLSCTISREDSKRRRFYPLTCHWRMAESNHYILLLNEATGKNMNIFQRNSFPLNRTKQTLFCEKNPYK